MNICIIAPRYPYKDNMEFVFVKKLVDEWAKIGHRCVVVTDFSLTTYLRNRIEYKPRHYIDEISKNVTVEIYNPRVISTKLQIGGFSVDNYQSILAIERQLDRLHIKFDFIYCHFFSSALKVFRYAKRNNIPLFMATGESSIGVPSIPYKGFTWEDFRSTLKGVVAVSSKNKKVAAELGLIDYTKCRVYPNGTDLSLFRKLDRNECRKKLGLSNDVFIVICVGYLIKRKGQDRVLAAVNTLNDSNIKLIFAGGHFNSSEDIVLEGDNIIFKGKVGNNELPIYYNAADIFCLPTQAEGCCNAVIEALSCGLPVVSSNLPFNWDVLDDSNSIMVDPDNINEIAQAIKRLRSDKYLCQRLSDGALRKSETLSLKHRAESIMTFVEENI